MTGFLTLGDVYTSLALTAAARSAYERASALDAGAAEPHDRLARLALLQGDPRQARAHAQEALQRSPQACFRVTLGVAARLIGELSAARFAFAAAATARDADRWVLAAAHVGRAQVAFQEGDSGGALAQLGATVGQRPRDPDVLYDLAALAISLGQWQELRDRFDEEIGRPPDDPSLHFGRALTLALAQAQDAPALPDAEIEDGLALALALDAGHHPARMLLARRLSRRRFQDGGARNAAIAELERLALALESEPAPPPPVWPRTLAAVELSRVYLLLGSILEEDPQLGERAAAYYEKGILRAPLQPAALNNLGVLALDRGEAARGREFFAAALSADPAYEPAYENLARMLLFDDAPANLAAHLGAVMTRVAAPSHEVASRLLAATAQLARADTFEALYSKGHQLKNLLGVLGARLRNARRSIEGPGGERLDELLKRFSELYDEWAGYLRSMKEEAPSREVIAVNALLFEVVAAASGPGRMIRFRPATGLPDIQGDRPRLREALLNLVQNGLEAQGESEQPLEITTGLQSGGGSTRVEISIKDHGPGIARADLRRIFAPGFTTKPQGSGYGLSVAERVVAAHGGRIVVESDEGQGTLMRVLVPTDFEGRPHTGGPGGLSTLRRASAAEIGAPEEA